MMLVLPLDRKVSTNAVYSGMHWTTRAKHADYYHALIKKQCAEQNIKQVENYPCMIIVEYFFDKKPMDATNCFWMTKWIEDGLRKAGIIVDDTPAHVEFIGCASKVDKENPRIEISIMES